MPYQVQNLSPQWREFEYTRAAEGANKAQLDAEYAKIAENHPDWTDDQIRLAQQGQLGGTREPIYRIPNPQQSGQAPPDSAPPEQPAWYRAGPPAPVVAPSGVQPSRSASSGFIGTPGGENQFDKNAYQVSFPAQPQPVLNFKSYSGPTKAELEGQSREAQIELANGVDPAQVMQDHPDFRLNPKYAFKVGMASAIQDKKDQAANAPEAVAAKAFKVTKAREAIQRTLDNLPSGTPDYITAALNKKAADMDASATNAPALNLGGEAPFRIGAQPTGPIQVNSQAEYDALPPGTAYVDSNGKPATKKK